MKNRAQSSLRVLVVEDNPNILRIMKELLEADGHRVDIAANGEEGIKQLELNEYGLIITDLGLPGVSGWELARASKRYQSDTPVLAISSWQGKEARQKLADSDIDVVIWKPFRFNQIKESITALCSSAGRDLPSK